MTLPQIAYTYILVRADLSPEMQVVQAAHAAMEAAYRFPKISVESYLVVLSVPDEAALVLAYNRLAYRKGIACELFEEPDLGNSYTALASEPLIVRGKRKAFFPYPKHRAGLVQVQNLVPIGDEEGGTAPSPRTIAAVAQR